MRKTDISIHNIAIASIKRSTIKPYDFKWTKFYEFNMDFPYAELSPNLSENELIICSTVIDAKNYSVLTSQKIITSENGVLQSGDHFGATLKPFGNFKGFQGDPYTFGSLLLKNGTELKYFIETGKASMVMIYGMKTVVQIQN